MGEDACCFNLDEDDDAMRAYIADRIAEAARSAAEGKGVARMTTGRYVALDFETSGYAAHSACAVGLCRIEDGVVTDSFTA